MPKRRAAWDLGMPRCSMAWTIFVYGHNLWGN
jgi:hypothetical protein